MAVDSSGIRHAARQEAVDSLAQRGSLICVGNGEGIVLVGRTLTNWFVPNGYYSQ